MVPMETRETNVLLLSFFLLLLAFSVAPPQYVGRVVGQCVDGDGMDYFFKGMVTVSGGHEVWDTCVEDTTIVQEFSCDEGELAFTFHTCAGGCQDGKCLAVPSVPVAVSEGGEEVSFGTSGDQVELNEYLGDVQSAFTEGELAALEGGMVSTGNSVTEFHQYLRFDDSIKTGRVVFGENEDGQVGDFLRFLSTDYIFEYKLEFEDGLLSSVSGNSLADLDGRELFVLGQEYRIAGAQKSGNTVTLRLVGGEHGDVLDEGEQKTYVVGAQEFVIEVVTLDDSQHEVVLKINGKMHSPLEEGDVVFVNGMLIGIDELYFHEQGEGKDFLQLVVGARTLEFRDDASDSGFSSSLKVNGQLISEGLVQLKGKSSGDDYELLSLTYRLRPDALSGGDVYIAPGHGVRDYIEESEAMLGSWDLRYDGLKKKGMNEIVFDPVSKNQYQLRFTNGKDHQYVVGVVYNNGGNLEISDKGDTVHFLEAASSSSFVVDTGDYLIVTNKNTPSGITHLVRYDSIDTAGKTLQFDDGAEGSKTVTYTGTEGTDAQGDLILSGTTYRVFVGGGPAYNLAVDLDGDGDVDGSEVNVVVKGGGLLDLGSSLTPGSDFEVTLTTKGQQFDENPVDEVITFDVLRSGSEIDIRIDAQSSLSIETDDDKTKAMSRYGAYIEKDNGNPDRVVIEYPLEQVFGNVRLVFSPGKVTSVDSVDDCGNGVCDSDEGYMNCASDCAFVEIKEEQPVLTLETLCGNGICDEAAASCPQDCPVEEIPAVVSVVEEENGFWERLWEWIKGLF